MDGVATLRTKTTPDPEEQPSYVNVFAVQIWESNSSSPKKKKVNVIKSTENKFEPNKYYKNFPPTKGKVLNGKTKINLFASQKTFHGCMSSHVSHKSKVRYTLAGEETPCVSPTRYLCPNYCSSQNSVLFHLPGSQEHPFLAS